MSDDDREDAALDALIASFHQVSTDDELIPMDDPVILSDEDRAALESLGTSEELVGRLWAEVEAEDIAKALAELWRHRRELTEDEFDEAED